MSVKQRDFFGMNAGNEHEEEIGSREIGRRKN
jgi:hypothetical protein